MNKDVLMNSAKLESLLLKEKLDTIREIQDYNESSFSSRTLNIYLEDLKTKYILQSRREK